MNDTSTCAIQMRGIHLTQAQLDVITPLLNDQLKPRKKLPNLDFEQKCVDAIAAAGHPLKELPERAKLSKMTLSQSLLERRRRFFDYILADNHTADEAYEGAMSVMG